TYPMRRRSGTGAIVATSTPSISTEPRVGSTIRLMSLSSVVLPLPDEPTRTVMRRAGMMRLKSLTASAPPSKVFETERNSIICGLYRETSSECSVKRAVCGLTGLLDDRAVALGVEAERASVEPVCEREGHLELVDESVTLEPVVLCEDVDERLDHGRKAR